MDIEQLLQKIKSCDRRSIAKAITLLESSREIDFEIKNQLMKKFKNTNLRKNLYELHSLESLVLEKVLSLKKLGYIFYPLVKKLPFWPLILQVQSREGVF